jgi:hypothetical protein
VRRRYEALLAVVDRLEAHDDAVHPDIVTLRPAPASLDTLTADASRMVDGEHRRNAP